MPKDARRRAQKMMERRQKQKAKQKRAAKATVSKTDGAIVKRSCRYPLCECLISSGWQEQGIAAILVARHQSESLIVFGNFIVDTYCMGIKNAHSRANVSVAQYEGDIRPFYQRNHGAHRIPLELACQIIYGAEDYAASLGLRPHKDYALARHILEPRESIQPNSDLVFGKDGKPLYIQGPHDHASRIMDHLERKLGPEGFHYILLVEDEEDSLIEYDDE